MSNSSMVSSPHCEKMWLRGGAVALRLSARSFVCVRPRSVSLPIEQRFFADFFPAPRACHCFCQEIIGVSAAEKHYLVEQGVERHLRVIATLLTTEDFPASGGDHFRADGKQDCFPFFVHACSPKKEFRYSSPIKSLR